MEQFRPYEFFDWEYGREFDLPPDFPEWDRFELEMEGRCGDAEFHHRERIWFTSGTTTVRVPEPKFRNPAGYGEPSLYEVTVVIRNAGAELIRSTRVIGIRRVKLVYDETPGLFQFRFEVNGTPIMVKGTDHVPADALHSRDAERMPRILEMVKELGCNMIRVWGGGVCEPAQFYDFCDRNGILVWQDFMMACVGYPMTPDFMDRIRMECEWAVRELRQHLAVILDEPESWGHRVIVTNDTLQPCAGTIMIRDLENGETLWNGSFRVGANVNATAGVFEHPADRERLLLVEWRAGKESGCGFRLTGQPPHDFVRYRNLLPELLRQIN